MAERRGSHTLPAARIGSGVSTGGTKKNTGDLLTAGQNLGFDRPPQKIKNAPIYVRMQSVVQRMLHSEHGIPIKSHKRRLISAIPSAFTGADVVSWLSRNLSIQSKVEAIHMANLICRHGYFFCVEGVSTQVKDDNTLFRFQTPSYWPSQNPDISDFEYGVYLVKQVLRSKQRIRLLDYELNNLHKLKLRLAKQWKEITSKADDDVKVFEEQKRIAKAIMSSQEEAFWRLHRPPPGESCVLDATLTRFGTERLPPPESEWSEDELKKEYDFLQASRKRTRMKVSVAVESIIAYTRKYKEHDPILTPSIPSNPWITNDSTLWDLEKSLIEYPHVRQLRKWACSLHDLLCDVTGRFRYEEYCKLEYSLENVRFWQACQDLKAIPLEAVEGSVRLIYDEFLQHGSRSEVNVSADVQEKVEKDLKNPSRLSFSSAQEQIYKLMQNDVYPRFLKSDHYQQMISKGIEMEEAGRGFFSRLQRKKIDSVVKQDATGISPCLPQRYAKRQLSIGRKMSRSAGGSSSLDNIFLSCGNSSDTKRNSAYTEAFIDSLMSPEPDKILADELRQRRVSAPPSSLQAFTKPFDSVLENIDEDEVGVTGFHAHSSGIDASLPMSYSADDLQQLMEDANAIGSSKWKKFGITAGVSFNDPSSTEKLVVGKRRSISQSSGQASDAIATPILELPGSPNNDTAPLKAKLLSQN